MITRSIPTSRLPEALFFELERVAREQDRPVDEVLVDAVDLYLMMHKAEQRTGSDRSRRRALTPVELQHLMEEFRRDRM